MKGGFLENCFVILEEKGKTVFTSDRGIKRAVDQTIKWANESGKNKANLFAKIDI